jgi:hypothetical protein
MGQVRKPRQPLHVGLSRVGNLDRILRPANRRENRDGQDRLQRVQWSRMLATRSVDHGEKANIWSIAGGWAMERPFA